MPVTRDFKIIKNLLFKLIFFSEPYTPSATRPPATPGECSGKTNKNPSFIDQSEAFIVHSNCSGIDCNLIPSQTRGASLGWVVGPVVAGIGLALLVVFVIVFKRKRQPLKQPMDGGQVTTPLMSGFDMANASVIAPSDPVELRRMNFQVVLTPKPFGIF